VAEEDFPSARQFAEEALELDRRLGYAWGTAYSGFLLGQVALFEGDHASALPLLDESARALSALGDEVYGLVASVHLAWTYYELGQRDRGRALEEENLRRAREGSHERIEAMTLDLLAEYALDDGRIEDALSLLRGAVRIFHDLGDRGLGATSLSHFGHALARRGRAGDPSAWLGPRMLSLQTLRGAFPDGSHRGTSKRSRRRANSSTRRPSPRRGRKGAR
jgi:tetratricopeptide (TPR) repeat protein